ncbi:unnamed protein product, partial [Prorocentrum cordatum]
VDFLTLMVFFHVLMGAIDEEAQCLHSLSATTQGGDRDHLAPEVPADGAADAHGRPDDAGGVLMDAAAGRARPPAAFKSPRSPSGSAGALAAISEEGSSEASDGERGTAPRGADPVAEAAAEAAAGADPEGRRICGLLMRFDPRQLRAEFQQLYLNHGPIGMHHGAGAPHSPRAPGEPGGASDARGVQQQGQPADPAAQARRVRVATERMRVRHTMAEAKKE